MDRMRLLAALALVLALLLGAFLLRSFEHGRPEADTLGVDARAHETAEHQVELARTAEPEEKPANAREAQTTSDELASPASVAKESVLLEVIDATSNAPLAGAEVLYTVGDATWLRSE